MLSDLVRRPQGRVAQHIAAVGEAQVCTSIIVAAELRFGGAKSGPRHLRNQVDAILSAITVLPLGSPVETHYAAIRKTLEQGGILIGSNDLLIAAHARALECMLVTANEREFKRVPGLNVRDWLGQPTHEQPEQA